MDRPIRWGSLTICWFALLTCPIAAVVCARETDYMAAAIMIFTSAMAGAIHRQIGGIERL